MTYAAYVVCGRILDPANRQRSRIPMPACGLVCKAVMSGMHQWHLDVLQIAHLLILKFPGQRWQQED